jgi:hypothetical protein
LQVHQTRAYRDAPQKKNASEKMEAVESSGSGVRGFHDSLPDVTLGESEEESALVLAPAKQQVLRRCASE